MSGRMLDCVGIDSARSGLGNHAYVPSGEPIVQGVGDIRVGATSP
jgi:hypothetical protein